MPVINGHHPNPSPNPMLRSSRFEAGSTSLLVFSLVFVFAALLLLSACGGSSSSPSPTNGSLSGNWQFTVAPPADNSFVGGLQGGFLLAKSGAVTGGATYSVALPGQGGTVCNSGSASITGTVSGQTVNLTAVAGTQTFTFTGTLSADGSSMSGTYASTAGTAPDGSSCGTAQTGLQFSAALVPPVTGSIKGSFHSTGGLNNQDFVLTGSLAQGQNIGASNATVTGSLSFVDPTTLISNYPCFGTAAVNGQISGDTIILQIIGTDPSNSGSILGQIGGVLNSGVNAVTVASTANGNVLRDVAGPGYAVVSKPCLGAGVITNPGDSGNICLALNGSNACQEPITVSPALLVFPSQALGSTSASQTITVTNSSGASLTGLTLSWIVASGPFSYGSEGFSDFNGLPNFQAQDTCVPGGETLAPDSVGSSFTLSAGQSCGVAVTFSPQESCPWIPFGSPVSSSGAPPAFCPLPLGATVTVNNPNPDNTDPQPSIAVPITGTGLSAIQPSRAGLDFGAEALLTPPNPPEASVPQMLTFTNQSANPVQILGAAPAPCTNPPAGSLTLVRPLTSASGVGGLQVVGSQPGVHNNITPANDTILYNCDSDPQTTMPNFQISQDACTGVTLPAQASCSLQITYVPQPGTILASGLDYFLELNTLQCTSSTTSDCEIDAGRFPVELTANPSSPLRMAPSAGLDFGVVPVGNSTAAQTISLLNDNNPNLPNPRTVTFVGKVLVSGSSYTETDDCPASLAPGASCTLSVTFKAKAAGFNKGSLTINYTTSDPTDAPQTVHLRGTGQ